MRFYQWCEPSHSELRVSRSLRRRSHALLRNNIAGSFKKNVQEKSRWSFEFSQKGGINFNVRPTTVMGGDIKRVGLKLKNFKNF